jgi:hypothetical protein
MGAGSSLVMFQIFPGLVVLNTAKIVVGVALEATLTKVLFFDQLIVELVGSASASVVVGSFPERLRKLAYFTGKSALDIEGLGVKTVELLMEHELVSDYDDFFDITYDELLKLPTFKETSARNVIDAIEEKKVGDHRGRV